MVNLISFLVLVAILGSAVWYLYQAKKNGVKCVGCPSGASCSCGGHSSSGGCSCSSGK